MRYAKYPTEDRPVQLFLTLLSSKVNRDFTKQTKFTEIIVVVNNVSILVIFILLHQLHAPSLAERATAVTFSSSTALCVRRQANLSLLRDRYGLFRTMTSPKKITFRSTIPLGAGRAPALSLCGLTANGSLPHRAKVLNPFSNSLLVVLF